MREACGRTGEQTGRQAGKRTGKPAGYQERKVRARVEKYDVRERSFQGTVIVQKRGEKRSKRISPSQVVLGCKNQPAVLIERQKPGGDIILFTPSSFLRG